MLKVLADVYLLLAHLLLCDAFFYLYPEKGRKRELTTSLHVNIATPRLPTCNDDQLMMFLADIQAINPESIVNLATTDDLAALCQRVASNLEKTEAYLKKCTLMNQRDLYVKLIDGVDSLHHKLCKNGTFQKEFKSFHSCYHKLSTDYEDCSGPSDWTENSNETKICSAYKDISDCYFIKTAKLCGERAAHLMNELIQAVINSILVVDCSKVQNIPLVRDAMPESCGASLQPPKFIYILLYKMIVE